MTSYSCPFVFRFDDESVKTSEFTDDMDELFLWVDETENFLSIPLEQGEEKLEESLEKFKVSCFNYMFVLNLMLMHFVFHVTFRKHSLSSSFIE